MSKTPAASSAPGGSGGRGVPVPKMKRGFGAFITDVRRELTKVSWPTIPETHRLTGVVLAVCLLLTVVLGVLSGVIGLIIDFLQGTHSV